MRVWRICELLLWCLIIAFSAYGRVIDRDETTLHRSIRAVKKQDSLMTLTLPSLKQAEETINKHCFCKENVCSCCREFHIPLLPLTGPGCASLQYLHGDKLQVQLSYGQRVLTTRIISGNNPKPVCVNLPGGYSQFCGKFYSIKKESDRHFKACLGLQLQSSNELEASLRVSCFRFGPDGLELRPAEEFPQVVTEAAPDDDDDDDLFGLVDDDDDEDEEEEEEEDDGVNPEGNQVADANAEDDEDEDDDDDVLGFGALLDIFTGDDETTKKPKVTTAIPFIQPFTVPTFPTSASPVAEILNHVPEVAEVTANQLPSSPPVVNTVVTKPQEPVTVKVEAEPVAEASGDGSSEVIEVEQEPTTDNVVEKDHTVVKKPETVETVDVLVKPEKSQTIKIKKVPAKPSLTSSSINAIKNEVKKPLVRPSTPDPSINDVVPHEHEEDDDDEDDILGTDDLDEEDDDDDDEKEEDDEDVDEDEEEEHETSAEEDEEEEDQKDDDLEEELEDDDEEEEEEALSAIIEEDKEKLKQKKVQNKIPNKLSNEAGNQEEDDGDYGYGLAELLARKMPRSSRGRESKVMRL